LQTKVIISQSTNPFFNLSLEDWALQNLDTRSTDYLILYVNKPAIILGRNQNLFQEINLNYCIQHDIQIARRISGGGTVFHDEGNLNWAWISSFHANKVNQYLWSASLILNLLHSYGLDAYLNARNAIEVNQLKLSGQAQFTNKKNILSHGTLLLESNFSKMQFAIEPLESIKIQSKASPSVRSKTANLNDLLLHKITMKQLIQDLVKQANASHFDLDFTMIRSEKLQSIAWIYERCPKFSVQCYINNSLSIFEVEKGSIISHKNEKGHLLKDSPFLNQTYESFVRKFIG
jgi:lipoate-protein ligase A